MIRIACVSWMMLVSLVCQGTALRRACAETASAGTSLTAAVFSTIDQDFAYMGEYWGTVQSPYSGREFTGLQVIAQGGGKFQAVRYRGGLPGAGWDQSSPQRLSGNLDGNTVWFDDGDQQITIRYGAATILHSSRHQLGRLQKIARSSPTIGAPAPPGALVLFDGSNTDLLQGASVTADRLLEAGVTTKMPVGDFRMHVEFRTPYMPSSRGQARGNSGVYIQRRYEVQILDSFGLEGVENECGGLYKQQRPDINMCLPPLSWQTYDIHFTAARWNRREEKIANARITVLHNGVPIHSDREIVGKTGAGRPETPEPLPILLQDHRDAVTFRNVWIVLGDARSGAGGCVCR